MGMAFTLQGSSLSRREPDYMLARTSGKDEMLRTSRFISIARHFDWAVISGGRALYESLRVQGAGAAGAVRHTLRDTAAVGIHKPAQVEHFTKRKSPEIQVEAGDKHVMIRIEQVASKKKKITYK